MRKIILIITIIMVTPTLTFSIDKKTGVWKNDEDVPNIHFDKDFIPYTVLSIGFSYRTDNSSYLSQTPTLRIRMYSYVKPFIAMKFGLGYNNSTKTKNSIYYNTEEISDLILEGGLRFQEPRGDISFYFETGFESHNYIVHRGTPDNISKSGFNIAMGGEFKISKNSKIDLSVRHTFNHVLNNYVVDILSPSPPIEWDINIEYYNRNLADSFFNPTSIQLMYSFKL